MLEFIVLGLLYKEILTGYDLQKRIEQGVGLFYKASFGSLYPLLNRLTKGGFLLCHESKEGRRVKKSYEITKEGRSRFMTWLLENPDSGITTEGFMAKVYFADMIEPAQIQNQIKVYESYLNTYKEELLILKQQYNSPKNQKEYYYMMSTLYFGIAKLDSIITWCKVTANHDNLDTLI